MCFPVSSSVYVSLAKRRNGVGRPERRKNTCNEGLATFEVAKKQ